MRRRLFAPFASTLVVLGIAFLTSCGSSLSGPNGAAGSGGSDPSGAGGAGTGGMATGGAAGGAGAAGGGSGGRGGAGGKAGAPGTGGAQVGGKGGGAAPCGAQSCASNEVCVHPGCGGGVAVCEPVPDGGQCPAGWTLSPCFANASRMGCMPGPCTPPAPFCAPLPASCGGTPNCICLPFDVCGQNGGTCSGILLSGGVMCGFA